MPSLHVKTRRFYSYKMGLGLLLLLLSPLLRAEDTQEKLTLIPANTTDIRWVFSGMVANENGERFGYIFQLHQHQKEMNAMVALIDAQGHELIWFDETASQQTKTDPNYWEVGRAFLRFNPINDSWIFGLKTDNHIGFNFKVDMLSQANHPSLTRELTPGINLLVSQTNSLNGHLYLGQPDTSQFVTANNIWLEQIWVTDPNVNQELISGVQCRFDDGSGFYAINTDASETWLSSLSGWLDSQGVAANMSQFVSLSPGEEEAWHIHIATPKKHFVFIDEVKQKKLAAGFLTQSAVPGFCMLTRH